MRHVFFGVLLACALGAASAATAAPPAQQHVNGNGSYGATKFEVAAQTNPHDGAPQGHITLQTPAGVYHGDVRDGCIWVTGDRGVVVGATGDPAAPYVGVVIDVSGRGDRAFASLLTAEQGQAMCLGAMGAFATVPVDQGKTQISTR